MIGGLGYAGFLDGGGGGGTGGGDTLQDVIINGNVLTQNNTIDGTGYSLAIKSNYFSVIGQDNGNGFNFDGENTQVNFNKNADVNFTATIFDFFAHDTDPVYLCLNPEDSYINFDAADYGSGATGYGIRDNAGTMQFKNLLGDWGDFASGFTGWDDMLSVGQLQTANRLIDANTFALGINNLSNLEISNQFANQYFSILKSGDFYIRGDVGEDGSVYGITCAINPSGAVAFNSTNTAVDNYTSALTIGSGADKKDISFPNTGNFIVDNPDHDQKVGIGTSTPTEALDVVGNIKTNSGVILPTYPNIDLTTGDYTATTAGIYKITQGSLTNSFILPDPTDLNGQTITVVNASGVISPVTGGTFVTDLQDDSVTIFSAIFGLWYGLAK